MSRARLRWAALALVAAVALVAWLATRGGSSGSADGEVLTRTELAQAAREAGIPVYWAGPAVNAEYRLLDAGDGKQVSYVPAGVDDPAAAARALTVGSYPVADPAAAIRRIAARPGAIVRHSPSGRTVVGSKSNPSSVYFAGVGGEVEVEVYAPAPGRAMRLALSDRVRPVR